MLRLDDVYFLTVTGNVIKTTPDFGEAPRLSSEDAAYTEALCGIYARQDGEMTENVEWVQVQV